MKFNIIRDENGKIVSVEGTNQDPNKPLSKDELEFLQNLTVKLIETEIILENTEKNKRKPLSRNDRDLQRDLYYLSRRHG